jgi:cell division protease FtsH
MTAGGPRGYAADRSLVKVKQQHKTLIVWLVFILIVITIWVAFARPGEKVDERSFAQLIGQLEKGDVKDVQIQETSKGWVFTGEYKADKSRFVSLGLMNDVVQSSLQTAYGQHGTTYQIEPREQGGIWIVLLQWIPMLLIIVLFLFFMKQLQSGGGKAMSFGKSKARLINENQNKVNFGDVAGVDECKTELEEIVHFLKDPKKFTRLGGRIPKGVLLMGPPGTGKTLLARAIAGEAGVPFFSIAGSDFVEMFVGVGASRVRDLFEQGKKNAPCIIFIDEIDAVGRHRGAGMGGGHDEREQTLNQLLVEMDGFESNEGVIIIAATNRPDVLDPAILRPGRFDRRVVVPRPDVVGRQAILAVHAKKTPLAPDVDLEILARATPGMSGADLENLVNEAALVAARRDKSKVNMEDFESARDKVLMGSERRSLVMTEKELETTAYHESGHALVSSLLVDESDPVHKVTIIPRGAALGITMRLPDDRHTYSKRYAENLIAVLMGGRIAEELIFAQFNTGAADDIDKATDLARRMVTQWGMSEKLGPLSYGRKEGEVFLGREMTQSQDYSEKTAQEIDAEVRRIVSEQYERARRLLEANTEKLHAISKALLEYETIDMKDIEVLMRGDALTRARPTVRIKTREQLEEDRKTRDAEKKAPPILQDPFPEPGTA